MRWSPIALALAAPLVACHVRPSIPPRDDLRCTPQAEDAESACAQQGSDCSLMPREDRCPYVDAPPPPKRRADVLDHARAQALGTLPCECVCQHDLEQCRRAP